MSEIRINILDHNGSIHGTLHGSFTDALLASLMAEPETIAEFKLALERFEKPTETWTPLGSFKYGKSFEPYDAGILIIDLAGRLICCESTYSYASREGSVRIDSEFSDYADDDGYVYVPYKIPNDWRIVGTVLEFEGMSEVARRERSKTPFFDARTFLYGQPMITFLLTKLSAAADLDSEDLFVEIHAEWLMTPCEGLFGKTPREVLLEKNDFIGYDLDTRSRQYSFTKVCPKPIPVSSSAYRFAGFGTNEIVIYYDLVRELLYRAVELLKIETDLNHEGRTSRLEQIRDHWLESDNPEFRRPPREIIENERRRLNMTSTAHEVLIDEDCPCCVALSEDFDTPMFWYLDGCNLEDRFEFSFELTRAEWEAEQERSRQFNADFDAGKYNSLAEDREPPF
jgi:hypothetical protein